MFSEIILTNFAAAFFAVMAVFFFVLFISEKQKAKSDSECVNILFAQAGKANFYFDPQKAEILPSDSFELVFGRKISAALHLYNSLAEIIYNEDKNAYQKCIGIIREGKDVSDFRFRIRTESDDPVWCSLSTSALRTKHGKITTVIGSLGNIDKQVREEELLRFKAERDPLTGLYNKITTEMLITSTLLDRKYKNTINAMLMIDIDNLKQTNDRLGHIAGDKIITRLANCIRMLFRESDILGRVGGDEFAVFMKDCCSQEQVCAKAQKLCELYRTIMGEGNNSVQLSCSIGVAIFPDSGTTFMQLYSNADKALYDAKKNGKNSYALFTPSFMQCEA